MQACVNTRGSFTCTCTPGYQLGTDGRTCYRKWCNLNVLSNINASDLGKFEEIRYISSGPRNSVEVGGGKKYEIWPTLLAIFFLTSDILRLKIISGETEN